MDWLDQRAIVWQRVNVDLDEQRHQVASDMVSSKDEIARVLVSVLIVGTLLTQAVAGFVNTGRWGWPFLAYPMYETAHFEGERLADDLTAYAVLADSTRVPITRDDLGMSFWLYWYNVVQPIRHGHRDLLGPVMDRSCREHGDRLTGLEVKDRGIAIGRDGPVEGLPLQVMGQIAFVCP